jgi:hypothetical protein
VIPCRSFTLGERWIEANRLAIVCFGFFQLGLRVQHRAQLRVSLDKLRPGGEGAFITCLRCGHGQTALEDVARVVVCLGELRIQSHCIGIGTQRIVRTLLGGQNNSQIDVRGSVGRTHFDRLAKVRFGLGKAALAKPLRTARGVIEQDTRAARRRRWR